MKKHNRLPHYMFAALLGLVFVIAGSAAVFAAQPGTLDVENEVDITVELNRALDRTTEDVDGTLEITVPVGTYDISGNIYIYSDTVLNAEGCIFRYVNPDGGTMLKGAHVDKDERERCRADEPGSSASCSEGEYTQVQNVTVNGGTWDASPTGSATDTQCIMFRHAQNITLTGITAKGSTNHAFNISGVNKATITGCTFTAPLKYSGNDSNFWGDITEGDDTRFNSMESIHLDFTCKSGEPNAWPRDNTPCKNITVSNCTFNGVFSGVGTHHSNGDVSKRADNIVVKNCEFIGLRTKDSAEYYGRALTFYTANKVTFQDNKIDGAYNTVLLDNVKNVVVTNNKNINIKGNAFYVRNGCTGKITNNTVDTPLQTGIYVDASTVTVSNNSVSKAKKYGIVAIDAKGVKIASNTITGSAKNGIMAHVRDSKKTLTADIRGNTVKASGGLGILVQDGTNCIVYKNTVTGSASNGITVQGIKKKCTGSLVSYNTATGNKGKKDILLNTKCNNSKVQFNTIPKAGRLYCYTDGKVVNKGNHYTNAKTIKNAKITGITNKKYNKKAQGQSKLKVVVGGKTLKKNVHYKVTYENNVKKGPAKMYIIGQGAYKDYVTRTFKIK